MRILLIGGQSDGRRIDVSGSPRVIRIPVVREIGARVPEDECVLSAVSEETYMVEPVAPETYIGILRGLTGSSTSHLMALLVNGYREQLK